MEEMTQVASKLWTYTDLIKKKNNILRQWTLFPQNSRVGQHGVYSTYANVCNKKKTVQL